MTVRDSDLFQLWCTVSFTLLAVRKLKPSIKYLEVRSLFTLLQKDLSRRKKKKIHVIYKEDLFFQDLVSISKKSKNRCFYKLTFIDTRKCR